MLSRLGKDYTVTQTNVRAGTEMRVTTEREEMTVTLREMDEGSWIVLELPGFAKAASGKEQSSLDALRVARETSWYKDKDTLWLKLVSEGDPGTGAPAAGAINVVVSRKG